MLRIVLANLLLKNTKYANQGKIKGGSGMSFDGLSFFGF